MPLGVLFWVLYVVSIVLGAWGSYVPGQPFGFRGFGGYFVLWLLVGMLGWHVFGPVVR